jgi:amino acid adenylation domain-containing protein
MLDLKKSDLKNSGRIEITKSLNPSCSLSFSEKITEEFNLNENGSQESGFKNICELFEKQAQTHPNKIAVIFDEIRLTYGELSQKSTQLSNFLLKQGVQPESIIGLCLNNHSDLIVGILGILKAGGVYLPLDPNYPQERLQYMIEDAKPRIIISQTGLYHKFAHFYGKIVQIDRNIQEEPNRTAFPIKPEHLAYIIYTSGSTGKPKGIMITHGSLPEIVFARRDFFINHPTSLLSGSISFDPSIIVTLYTLISGGSLCIPSHELSTDVNKIIELIDRHSINFILCVPSLYSMFLDKTHMFNSLKNVVLVGESISNLIPQLHSELAPHAVLYNEYGPSEYAIGGTIAKIYDPLDKIIHQITIGKPLPKIHVYILDENLQPVTEGTKGEIFIGGPGLAKGYLNNQKLTIEKFIWLSLPGKPLIRLYRTGDFGRLLPDGNIEFLGRIDHQIKINGYRIELGEIEHALCQFQGIDEAVVVVQDNSINGKRLFSYFTSPNRIKIQELRVFLSNALPRHMIPHTFMQVEKFPLTPNGKIDRKALPEPIYEEVMINTFPKTDLEKIFLNVWQQVLLHDSFGIHDNFFDIGGCSLSITRVQTLLCRSHNLDVSITDLFQYPTIFQLAEYLSCKQKNEMAIQQVSFENQSAPEKRKAIFNRLKEFHREQKKHE